MKKLLLPLLLIMLIAAFASCENPINPPTPTPNLSQDELDAIAFVGYWWNTVAENGLHFKEDGTGTWDFGTKDDVYDLWWEINDGVFTMEVLDTSEPITGEPQEPIEDDPVMALLNFTRNNSDNDQIIEYTFTYTISDTEATIYSDGEEVLLIKTDPPPYLSN